MNIIKFEEFPEADLIVGSIYEGKPGGHISGEAISNLLPGSANLGGFRPSGKSGNWKFIVLYTTGEDQDWPDSIDDSTGLFTYYGDNKTPGRDLHDTPLRGNNILKNVFDALHSSPPKRNHIPPFFIFSKHTTQKSSRSVKFRGVAVPGHPDSSSAEDLSTVWGQKDNQRFQNYKAHFTILDIPEVSRSWVNDIIDGKPDSMHAPKAWVKWTKEGTYSPLKRNPSSTTNSIENTPLHDRRESMSKPTPPATPTTTTSSNAWIVRLNEETHSTPYSITIDIDSSLLPGLQTGDGILVAADDPLAAISFARIYRIRATHETTTLFFDALKPVEGKLLLKDLGVPPLKSKGAVIRLDWAVYESALSNALGIAPNELQTLGGNSLEQAYIRELLQLAVTDDLLGPADGPREEIIGMGVRDRYLVGKLAPQIPGTTIIEGGEDGQTAPPPQEELQPYEGRHQPGEEFSSTEGTSGQTEESGEEAETSSNQSLVPSSMGFTFCVDSDVPKLEVEVRWGSYERTHSERINEQTGNPYLCWKRIPSGGKIGVALSGRIISPQSPDPECPNVYIKGSVSEPLPNGDRLVTLFMVNNQTQPDTNQDEAWVFQPEVIVRDIEGRDIFRRRPVLNVDGIDTERESLEMIYRNHVEFAVGHGVSVHAIPNVDNPERAVEVRTKVLPDYEVPVTETPGLDEDDRPQMRQMVQDEILDMRKLAALSRDELVSTLGLLTEDYQSWISEQRDRIKADVSDHEDNANSAMDRCDHILSRLNEGIETLRIDDKALEAFRFANESMASQRVHGIYSLLKRRGEKPDLAELDIPKNRSWRPFQLAFVLLSIPPLADPTHKDRTESFEACADLLWFPTGGGKTEAYLGVAAFTMGIRRLQGNLGGLDNSRGLSVIMRYTLRLLTIQQFQRATALICAMEVIRRGDQEKWGTEPFSIGLWVGQKVTPNTTEEAHNAILAYRNKQWSKQISSPAQLTFCPWCGAEIDEGRDIQVKRFKNDVGRTIIYCGDKYSKCEFSKGKAKGVGLPITVVDDELYRRPPSMLIATVDKFAMMAWKGQVRTLFGRADLECERHGLLWPEAECTGNHIKRKGLPPTAVNEIESIRPPDLIIQDEFHLISGPLGTMVGLYETAIDELSTWTLGDKKVKPKIIASTATVRKAKDQVNNVFLRQVSVFPPHGLDVEDNFFSVQRSIEDKPGRRYMGICSPGSSRPAVLIRVNVALLTAAQSLFEHFGQAADPYMTVVGYFNSLRELGGMRRLAEDDVQTRAFRVQMSNVTRPGLSQRKVRSVDELTSRVSSKDIPKKLDHLEVKHKASYEKGEARGLDIVLATNMLSVGVDVNRLGLMIVNSQPKTTAEYIQATSRVGRSFPGLVCTVLTWARPRDLSHYETFEHYHATFYKHVEAQSVTPFAPRALDRGLTGIMVSMLRLNQNELNPNIGAGNFDSPARADLAEVKDLLSARAWNVKDKTAGDRTKAMVGDRSDRWVKEAQVPGRRLGYDKRRGQGDVASLLKRPGIAAWDELTAPMSMREVEPGVRLIMDESRSHDSPGWRSSVNDSDGGES